MELDVFICVFGVMLLLFFGDCLDFRWVFIYHINYFF